MSSLSKLLYHPIIQLKKINPTIFKTLNNWILANVDLFKINNIIEHNRILQYTGSTFHLVPVLINITTHKCLITNIWKFFHILLLITSFLNHKYKTTGLYCIDLITVLINSTLGLWFLYKNIENMSYKRLLLFLNLFLGSALAYIYGYKNNTMCFDKRLGYLWHAICHVCTAVSCILVLYPNKP